jgi:DNA-binding phage protein
MVASGCGCRSIYGTLPTAMKANPDIRETPSLFWQDLAQDLEDPAALREYIFESLRIATIDRLVNLLDEAREEENLSKAALARAINSHPAVIRRLLSNGAANPTVGTLVDVATALGLRVTLEPLPAAERRELTKSLHGVLTAARPSRIRDESTKATPKRELVAV